MLRQKTKKDKAWHSWRRWFKEDCKLYVYALTQSGKVELLCIDRSTQPDLYRSFVDKDL